MARTRTGGGGQQRQREVLVGQGYDPVRIWTILFRLRHVAIVLLAIAMLTLPRAGHDRWEAVAALMGLVLPYDLLLHRFARRTRRLARSMIVVYPLVPAAFAAAFPATWVPALLAGLANLALFAATFPMRDTAVATALTVGGFVAATPFARPDHAVTVVASFVVVAPALAIAVGVLFQALLVSDQRYRELLENANDMIYTHQLSGDMLFLSANDAALRLTGYTREELGSISVTDVVAPDSFQKARAMVLAKLADEKERTTYEIEIVTKDGRRIPVEVSSHIIRRRGVPVAVQGIARDVTERKQVEEQRRNLEQARTEFIANAAHELRTPLTTLAGLAAVLANRRHRMTEEELDGAIEALHRQGRRARMLADKLLDYSSIVLGRLDVAGESVPVAAAARRVLDAVPPPEGTTVEVHVPNGLAVWADPVRLEEILSNLLTNAYRYGGPHVQIDADARGGSVFLTVADDGAGVPPDLAEYIFEPFTRGSHEPSPPDSTGLGLAICARLADALGGDIAYEPGQPTGARFRVRLPATP